MQRLIVYMMAAITGLVLAVILGMPILLAIPQNAANAPEETETMRVYRTEAQEAGTQAALAPSGSGPGGAPASLSDNQTLLAADLASGSVLASVNGKPMGDLRPGEPLDISALVWPGENEVILKWSEPVEGEVVVRHAAHAGDFRESASAFLIPAETGTAGERAIRFYL